MKLSRTWQRLAFASTMISTIVLSTSAMAQDAVQLTFRQFDPPTEIDGLIAAVDAWNASHPNIQVKLETLGGGDTLAQLAREIPAGAGPDVQQMRSSGRVT
jgi:multiple sugar transport system substrate-binding protein